MAAEAQRGRRPGQVALVGGIAGEVDETSVGRYEGAVAPQKLRRRLPLRGGPSRIRRRLGVGLGRALSNGRVGLGCEVDDGGGLQPGRHRLGPSGRGARTIGPSTRAQTGHLLHRRGTRGRPRQDEGGIASRATRGWGFDLDDVVIACGLGEHVVPWQGHRMAKARGGEAPCKGQGLARPEGPASQPRRWARGGGWTMSER